MEKEQEAEVRLVGLSGALKDKTFTLEKEDFLIGRARDCDLRIDENTISGRHARILKVQDHYEVEDLQSTNGTFLNGLRVNRKRLRSGDKIKFDQFEFEFIDPADVSRTLVATPEALAEAQRTTVRPAATIPLAPSPAVPKPPVPSPVVRPPTEIPATPAHTRGGRLAGGVAAAVLVAFLVGLGGNILFQQALIASRGGSFLGSAWDNLVVMAQSYPVMHQAHLWVSADLSRWQNIASILLIILSVVLGGVLVQSIGRRNRVGSAAAFSFFFVLAALLVQAAALRFQVQALALFYTGLVRGLAPWPSFGLGLLYIFGVVFVLSLFGALLVRQKR